MLIDPGGDMPAQPGLSRLEALILAAFEPADAGHRDHLRAQIERATVVTRTYSGVGFMTRFRVPDPLPGRVDGIVPPVYGEHPRLPGRAEFVLQLRSGRIHCLEAFCPEGQWPDDESGFRVVSC